MQVGFAQRTITPFTTMPMAGYDKRRMPFEGIHDDLYAKCLLLEDSGECLAIFSLDLLGIDESLSNEIIKMISACGDKLSDDRVLVCATHIHSGPSGIFSKKADFDGEYFRFLVEAFKEIYISAKGDFKPVFLQATCTEIDNLASVRNIIQPSAGQKIKAYVIKAVRDDGCVLLINLPCHPTVLDENNLYISRDLLYGLELGLKDFGIERSIFINGAAGNISTRYFKTAASFAEAERLGRKIARSVLKADSHGKQISDAVILSGKNNVLLKYKKNLSLKEKEEKKREIRDLIAKTGDSPLRRNYESALLVLERQDRNVGSLPDTVVKGGDCFKEAVIRLVRVGNLSIACVPFEICLETGQAISNIVDSGTGISLVFGYCGGYSGYIATEKCDINDYESIACQYESGSEQKLLEAFKYLSGNLM